MRGKSNLVPQNKPNKVNRHKLLMSEVKGNITTDCNH